MGKLSSHETDGTDTRYTHTLKLCPLSVKTYSNRHLHVIYWTCFPLRIFPALFFILIIEHKKLD